MPPSDFERRTQRASGASLALVLAAAAGTAGAGAFLKGQKSPVFEYLPAPIPVEDVSLRELAQGKGVAPVPGAPYAVSWIKLELVVNGKSIRHRPIQFKKELVDGSGRNLVLDHLWTGGYLYVFVREGYRSSSGPVHLNLSLRGKSCFRKTLDPLPPSKRVLASLTPPSTMASLEVVRVSHPNQKTELGLQVRAKGLEPDEGIAVRRLETTFSRHESRGPAYYAVLGSGESEGVVPFRVAYPEDAESARIQVSHLKAKREVRRLTFHLRYDGESLGHHQFSLHREVEDWAGGVYLTVSRYNRSVMVPKSGSEPLSLLLSTTQVQEHANVKVLYPATIHGVPFQVLGMVRGSQPGSVYARVDGANATPRPGESIPIELEVDLGVYHPIKNEFVVIPVHAKRARVANRTNSMPRPYNLEAWLPARPVLR